MKKINLFFALAAGVLAFSACSKTESGIAPENDGAAQQIVLKVANGGDGLTTRAGRPMFGSEAKQTIENVKLIICSDAPANAVVYVQTISDWNTTSAPYENKGHGREKLVDITANKLKPGKYTVYAFGYSNESDYNLAPITDIQSGVNFSPDTKIAFKELAKNNIGEEIFAGSISFTVADKKGNGFKKTIILNRQVAGVFGYVEDIPFFEGATNLKLVSSERNSELVLGQFANAQIEANGAATTVNYVINGTKPANDKVLFDVKLTDWFTQVKAGADGLLDIATWKNPYDGQATFKKGSVFGGNFVIPFAKTAENTLKLQLTNAGGNVLREWIVKLPATDKQLAEHDLFTWGTNFTSKKNTDSQKVYNIVRNHLYGIGTRTLDKPEFPEPGPGPEPEIDEPESLNNKQELILQVNDNWEVIHKMELE